MRYKLSPNLDILIYYTCSQIRSSNMVRKEMNAKEMAVNDRVHFWLYVGVLPLHDNNRGLEGRSLRRLYSIWLR